MEFIKLAKLAFRALINSIFRTEQVTATEKDYRGFHLYDYQGTPSVRPGFFNVRFRHIEDGCVVADKKFRMTEREWSDAKAAIEGHKEQAA